MLCLGRHDKIKIEIVYVPLVEKKEEIKVIKTIRDNINPPYSLHDMNVISFEAEGDNMIMKTQSGMIKTTPICTQTVWILNH